MIHLNQAASLALIFTYRASRSNNIEVEKVKEYQKRVNENLIRMKSMVSNLTPDYMVDIDGLFFYYAEFDGIGYYILKDDKRSIENRKKYIINTPLDIIIASQEEKALMTIGLTKLNGEIVKREELELVLSK
jgi:hypothetical protein